MIPLPRLEHSRPLARAAPAPKDRLTVHYPPKRRDLAVWLVEEWDALMDLPPRALWLAIATGLATALVLGLLLTLLV